MASGPHSVTVGDVETAAATLVVTATSSNTMLVPNGNGWQVTSLQTRDFDEALARLQDVAGGVRR